MTIIRIKPGARVQKIYPPMLKVLEIALELWRRYNLDVVITSGSERAKGRLKHSLHYEHRAYDFRVWGLTKKQKGELTQEFRRLLGADYDVLSKRTHIHVEYDPKVSRYFLEGERDDDRTLQEKYFA